MPESRLGLLYQGFGSLSKAFKDFLLYFLATLVFKGFNVIQSLLMLKRLTILNSFAQVSKFFLL